MLREDSAPELHKSNRAAEEASTQISGNCLSDPLAPTAACNMSTRAPAGQQSHISKLFYTRYFLVSLFIAALGSAALAGLVQPLSDTQKKMPEFWGRFSAVMGWLYFLAWSVSFYPQVVLNWRRRSVFGLSFDYQLLNLVGFGCYAIFNVTTFFHTQIRSEYIDAHHGDSPSVEVNDVFFAIHAFILTAITMVQVFLYRRSGETFAKWSLALSTGFVLAVVVYAIVSALSPDVGPKNARSWLSWSVSLSIMKLIISCLKYIPQVVLNFRHKSTVGWSIGNVLLDFTGGTLSVVQAFLDCSLSGQWSGIAGDPVKFGLGFVSIVFDIIFMTQHYVLYRSHEQGAPLRQFSDPLVSASTAV